MEIITYPNKKDWNTILKRPTKCVDDVEKIVLEVFDRVIKEKDEAIRAYTNIVVNVKLQDIVVTNEDIQNASNNISKGLKDAIILAKENIEIFHNAQKTSRVEVETAEGVSCWQEKRPIETVGIYIPGGTAPLFSTVLMLAIPAQLAGCKDIILCTPPNKQGKVASEILFAAQLCGVSKILKVGGIQAIAGLTFGTESMPKVHKIFGPGNQYVTVAKQIATKYGMAIDMPAGPSELLVVADDTANPEYVASDLLSQAEHGEDSQVILVSTSKILLSKVSLAIEKQLEELPRKAIAKKAIKHSKLILVENDTIALRLINDYAPEHFIISTKNDMFYVGGVQNAGSVFIGQYTPESAGDYASGTNHTLPTNGFSKAYSGVNLDSFLKTITFQKISKQGLLNIGPSIELMAEAEGLQAHKNAVTLRLKDIR